MPCFILKFVSCKYVHGEKLMDGLWNEAGYSIVTINFVSCKYVHGEKLMDGLWNEAGYSIVTINFAWYLCLQVVLQVIVSIIMDAFAIARRMKKLSSKRKTGIDRNGTCQQ